MAKDQLLAVTEPGRRGLLVAPIFYDVLSGPFGIEDSGAIQRRYAHLCIR